VLSVNEPVNEPAFVPVQNISAGFIVAMDAAAVVDASIVTDDFGPPSGQPFPLSPGPAARTGAVAGTSNAVEVRASTTSHESRRARRERARADVAVICRSPNVGPVAPV
jgi:hypothetical protein